MSTACEDDLFRKFKLKQHRITPPYTTKIRAERVESSKGNNQTMGRYVCRTTCDDCRGFSRRKIPAVRYDQPPANTTQHDNHRMIDHSIAELNLSFHCFDKLSTLEILSDHLRPFFNETIDITKESIKKISCLLIDTFIHWYQTLPFYSMMNLDFNQFVLNNHWSNYIILVVLYFLKRNSPPNKLISYEKSWTKVLKFTQTSSLSLLTNRILNQFLAFLSKFLQIHMTNTEFTLLSILLILQPDQTNPTDLNSLQQAHLQMLHTYETNTFPSQQPLRYNRLLHLCKEIHFLTHLLVTYQHFYLPFLFISN